MKIYGPYYRVKSPSQTEQVIQQQLEGKQIWGGNSRNYLKSNISKVKAYTKWTWGKGTTGIEFYTIIPPDEGGVPGSPTWSGDRPGVIIENGFAKINVVKIDRYPKSE